MRVPTLLATLLLLAVTPLPATPDRVAQISSEIARLTDEKRRAVENMRNGMFCSQCMRTQYEIEKGGESFSKHLKDVHGHPVPASADQIARKAAEYDRQIAALEREVNQMAEQARQERMREIQRAQQEQQRLVEDARRRQQEAIQQQQNAERQRVEVANAQRDKQLAALREQQAEFDRQAEARRRQLADEFDRRVPPPPPSFTPLPGTEPSAPAAEEPDASESPYQAWTDRAKDKLQQLREATRKAGEFGRETLHETARAMKDEAVDEIKTDDYAEDMKEFSKRTIHSVLDDAKDEIAKKAYDTAVDNLDEDSQFAVRAWRIPFAWATRNYNNIKAAYDDFMQKELFDKMDKIKTDSP